MLTSTAPGKQSMACTKGDSHSEIERVAPPRKQICEHAYPCQHGCAHTFSVISTALLMCSRSVASSTNW